MQPIFSATRDTKEAAALATLGIPIRIDKAIDSKTGREFYTFYLCAKTEEGAMLTSRLRRMYREKQLEAQTPGHPLLWCLVALRNRERLLDLANKGRFVSLVKMKGGQCLLQDSDQGLPGLAGKAVLTKITEMEMAVSLITIGIPLLSISGPQGQRVFYFENYSKPGATGPLSIPNVHALLINYRQGLLAASDPEHPLLYCMLSLYNRAAIVKAMREQVQMVILQKPRSPKSALVRADASDAAWERAEKHFGM